MDAFAEFKKKWRDTSSQVDMPRWNETELKSIIQSQMKKQNLLVMRYFWGTFILHVLIYAMLGHVMVKYGFFGLDAVLLAFSLLGIATTVPFTVALLAKFKRLANMQLADASLASLKNHLASRYKLLKSYYSIKKWYDYLVMPLHAILSLIIILRIFSQDYQSILSFPMLGILAVALGSCWWVIWGENKTYFLQPMSELAKRLKELEPGSR